MTTIYALIDPLTNQCRYVGKTINPERRLRDHIRVQKGSTYRDKWLNFLIASGRSPEMIVLEEIACNWQESEIFWIAYMKSLGAELANCTTGGDGAGLGSSHHCYGKIYTTEERKRISDKMIGIKRSKETINKMSECKLRENLSAETLRKRSEAVKGKPLSDEHKQKLCLARSKWVMTPESRRKQGESMKLYWAKKRESIISP